MKKDQEKKALFWCELLTPIIYEEVEEEQVNQYLKEISQKKLCFPDGTVKKVSVSTLRRKLNKYRQGGFDALARKRRSDLGKSRNTHSQAIEKAIELKKEQPFRSEQAINCFLKDQFDVTVPRSTLFRHLKQNGATKIKLGAVRKKVRKRWTRDNTNDLWVGDFEEGPYVLVGDQILPTHLSAFIDCHSRYVVEARYYLRQNLDVLIDSLIRATSIHGAPADIYLDNAKVYHATALKVACHRANIKLKYRPVRDAATGGLVERFFQTVQSQFESEVRAQEILTLDKLNQGLSAWLHIQYHQNIHSETEQTPQYRYDTGLRVVRNIDIQHFLSSFMQRVPRTVNKTFSDVRLNNRFYKVDPKLRGDRVEVRFDPFGNLDSVQIFSLKDESYLGQGKYHHRDSRGESSPQPEQNKPNHDLIDVLINQHEHALNQQVQGIDYTKVHQSRSWSFQDFVQKLAQLMGKKSGLSEFQSQDLESLKKFYNSHSKLSEELLVKAHLRAHEKSVPCILSELTQLLKEE